MMNKSLDIDSARKTALSILAYSDNTEKKLREKLKNKGFPDEMIDTVTDEMKSYGYLNEKRYIERAAEVLANEKLYGKYRIIMELRKKGFGSELIDGLDFSEIDFVGNCRRAIKKRGHMSSQSDVAAIMRRGYTVSEIKAAMGKG